jgi:predicted acyltransferase
LDHLNEIKYLFLTAFLLLAFGYIVAIWFPINKAIWSSSFVLVTSGWATLILAIIYYLKDIKQLKFGRIFKYVGMNAITIYFLSSFISKSMYLIKIGAHSNLHNYLYETIFVHSFFSDNFSSLLYGLTVVLMYLGLGYLMFRKKIFIKV